MPSVKDGPSSPNFSPLSIKGNLPLSKLPSVGVSEEMTSAFEQAPSGNCISWGITFEINDVVALVDHPVFIQLPPIRASWLVFMHTSDLHPVEWNNQGFVSPMRGQGKLGEHACNYRVLYKDGTEENLAIRRRHQIGTFQRIWGENCFESVSHIKPLPVRAHHEQVNPQWGRSQRRCDSVDKGSWVNWLWAWNNTHPDKSIVGLNLVPVSGIVILSAISYGEASSMPLCWQPRHKLIISLPEGMEFRPELSDMGLLEQMQLDMGQIISATPRPIYPNNNWSGSYNNKPPEFSNNEVLIEYTAHPDASFHLYDGSILPLSSIGKNEQKDQIRLIAPARKRITLRTIEKGSGKVIAVKLHVHGEAGEYLAPLDRHRIPNPSWFEDYSVDFTHLGTHHCTYIPGETCIDLPLGRVYIEVSKGFEIKPIHKVVEVKPDTENIEIYIEKVLPWREKGWVSADTHVHFLSPMSALLEGSAEGVNVVNLLASQWGELMTNVGDFDGRTTWGSRETGGDGEYLVRIGTENRQHVLGHISLLGYKGNIIVPMTTGGPNESALGDPIDILLTEWARQCKKQGGLVILPHFPDPRAEHAATVVSGDVDGIEMTSWGNLYGGINPYSLSDYYRYLNCGYLVSAVGGTDKMDAATAVGTVRTYAYIDQAQEFDYESWMEAVKRAETFVTYGPLLEFAVDGKRMGSRIKMTATGGTVSVSWEVASVTLPMSRVELIVNGEIRESVSVNPTRGAGEFSVKIDRSSWVALLVRGHYPDKPEIIAAHSSPVMVEVEGSEFHAKADALTILEQIEGAIAYLDTVGTRSETENYKRMRMILESAHRRIHNRMHLMGHYHKHTPGVEHKENH